MVDPVDEIERGVFLDRCRDDDLADAGVEVRLGLGHGLEDAGAVDDQVDGEARQRQVLDPACADERHAMVVDADPGFVVRKTRRPAAVDTVELEKVRVSSGVADTIV